MRPLYIATFGLCGVFSRYYVGLFVARLFPTAFPLGTFLINITGAFLIGVIHVFGAERTAIPADVRVGIMVGFLGGYTTFSSYCLELNRLVEDSEIFYAVLYFVLSSALGFLAAALGIYLARRLPA